MKADRTLVTHITEELENDFLGLLEYEKLMGNDNLTNSSLLNRIVTEYVNKHKTQYLLLSNVFKQNEQNGE